MALRRRLRSEAAELKAQAASSEDARSRAEAQLCTLRSDLSAALAEIANLAKARAEAEAARETAEIERALLEAQVHSVLDSHHAKSIKLYLLYLLTRMLACLLLSRFRVGTIGILLAIGGSASSDSIEYTFPIAFSEPDLW